MSTGKEKRGRKPKSEQPASVRFNARITPAFSKQVSDQAKKEGITKTELFEKSVKFYLSNT